MRKAGLSLLRLLWGLWALRDERCLSLGTSYKISPGDVSGEWRQMALACLWNSGPEFWYSLVFDLCEDVLPDMLVNTWGYLFPRPYSLCVFVFSGKPVLCPWRAPFQSSCPRRNPALSFHIARPFSSQAAEDQKEEPPHSIISSTETVQGTAFSRVGVWEGLAPGRPWGQVFEVEVMIDGTTHLLQTQEGLGRRERSSKQWMPPQNSWLSFGCVAPSSGHYGFAMGTF